MEYDVIIVGGSFSGLSSAYFLAQKGLKVCLFEGRKIYDRINSNDKLEILLQLLNSLPRRKIYETLERFSNLKYMHLRKTFFPCLFN